MIDELLKEHGIVHGFEVDQKKIDAFKQDLQLKVTMYGLGYIRSVLNGMVNDPEAKHCAEILEPKVKALEELFKGDE